MSILPSLPYLGIRFTHSSSEELSQIKQFMIEYAVPLIIVLEEADDEVNRTHMHSLIQTPITINTFRKQLKKKFPLFSGNDHYAITQVKDPDAMFRYVCKGTKIAPPKIIHSTYPTEMVANAYLAYWKENSELKKTPIKLKTKVLSWTEATLEELKQKIHCIDVVDEPTWKMLMRHTLDSLGKKGKKLNPRIITDITLGFANALLRENPNPKAYDSWCDHMSHHTFHTMLNVDFRN